MFARALPALLACSMTVAAADSFDWFAVGDLVRIFEDGYESPTPRRSVDVFGIRGETVSAQCALAARTRLEGVTVEMSALAAEGGARLPAGTVRWNFVGSVPVPVNTPGTRRTHLSRAAPARFPDYLAEERTLSLAPGRYQAVWLTIPIPRDAAPGRYNGTATVKTSAGSSALPLSLTVYPLEMPEQRHLMVTFWYGTGRFAKLHGTGEPYSESFYQVLKAYADDMAAHRQNVFRVSLSSVRARIGASGKLSFDFSRFDRWADTFWSTGRMDRLETGFVAKHGPKSWYDTTMPLDSWPAVQESGDSVAISGDRYLPQFLPALEAHLREKGWLDRTLFHIADEPANWNVAAWREASELVHRYAPALRRIDAIEATGFQGALEVWVPKLGHLNSWFDVYKKVQRQGSELWYYLAMPSEAYPNRFIDFPLIETRVLYWLNYRFGITGFLHWGYNSWTDDPFETMNEVRVGAGDAWTVYPKPGGVIDSLRWEATRNGLQDYEYLRLLEDRLGAIKAQTGCSWIDPTQRGVELAGRVIPRMTEYTRDPEVLYGAKAEILRELLDLERSPRLLVQTNPPEGSTIYSPPAFVEVFGLASPGAEVMMNGTAVPLDAKGRFATAVTLTPDQNVITVSARDSSGEKLARRSFRVAH